MVGHVRKARRRAWEVSLNTGGRRCIPQADAQVRRIQDEADAASKMLRSQIGSLKQKLAQSNASAEDTERRALALTNSYKVRASLTNHRASSHARYILR